MCSTWPQSSSQNVFVCLLQWIAFNKGYWNFSMKSNKSVGALSRKKAKSCLLMQTFVFLHTIATWFASNWQCERNVVNHDDLLWSYVGTSRFMSRQFPSTMRKIWTRREEPRQRKDTFKFMCVMYYCLFLVIF